jgi:2-polyprenyl-3-methyl-5-hydroxy-6-metoxy-1,4-benzoquinol methylase
LARAFPDKQFNNWQHPEYAALSIILAGLIEIQRSRRIMNKCLSPLTGGDNVCLLGHYDTGRLQQLWQRQFGIDIGPELADIERLAHWRCEDTGLEYFEPAAAAGSSRLYAQLSELPWYHESSRWEFEAALPWLEPGQRVLEVGAGHGAFLDILAVRPGISAVGIELNELAAKRARSSGHSVLSEPLEALSADELGCFDAVCSFQVLEHVIEPRLFVEQLLTRVVPGGLLIVGVPNKECFIRHWHPNLLDMPPHHMSRWSARTLGRLADVTGMELCKIEIESLAANHALDFLEAHLQRLLPGLAARALARLAGPILAFSTRIRSGIGGHSLLAIYRKPDISDSDSGGLNSITTGELV